MNVVAKRIFFWVGVVVALGLLALWLQPKVQQRLAPVPVAAMVAIEVAGSGLAIVGPVEIEAGTPFELHAVLEARGRSGERVFYTEARELSLDGVRIEPRPWDQQRRVQILWFTVEGMAPYVTLSADRTLVDLPFQEFFHPEWSTLWTADGVLEPRFDDQFGEPHADWLSFGTQHYQAWIEIFDQDNSLLPALRFKSLGPADMISRAAEFPAVRAVLPAARAASAVFGLSQIELPEDASADLVEDIVRLTRQGVVFSRLALLRNILAGTGGAIGEVEWQRVDLQSGLSWSSQMASHVAQGDLLQVGARWVVLYRDVGRLGVLDSEDLCMDFDQGASIRRLSDVFSGEGEVDWVSP